MLRAALVLAFALPAVAEDAKPVKVGDLSAAAPAGWVVEKPSNNLRSHQFKIKSGAEDVADAEIAVFPISSPDVMKSHDRWKATVTPADGVSPEDAFKVSKIDVKDATVTVLDMSGTWKYRERPQDPKSKEELRPEYRVIYVIVTTKDETAHVRFAGPAKVVEKNYKDFEGFLKALK